MPTDLLDAYRHCPICGGADLARHDEGITCRQCDHRIFNNPIAAVAVFVIDDRQRVLLIRRGSDPAKGKWAPPGGFLNPGETLEEAAAREVGEETGIALRDLHYLGSFPNDYVYRGLSRPVCDVFMTARTDSFVVKLNEGEASEAAMIPLAEIDPDELAFDSMRRALAVLRSLNS